MTSVSETLGMFRKFRLGGSDWSVALMILIALGAGAIVAFAMDIPFVAPDKAPALVGGILLAIACLLLGALLGFLFGIPRSLQEQAAAAEPSTPVTSQPGATAGAVALQSAAAGRPQMRYGANTNLEQISDWLTKILVGVGLTQLANLPGYLQRVATYFGPLFGNGGTGPQFALAAILAFTAGGFLFSYLWTRLFLATELTKADLTSMTERVAKLEVAQQEQAQIDATALSLTNQYLDPVNPPKVPIESFRSAIENASPAVKVQIFYQAQRLRSETWASHDKKPLMERTIPIFEALVASDQEGRFHRNFAQLGYALKDRRNPDYAAAEKHLSKAIEVRGPWREYGYTIYEFNRALCRIKMDGNFQQGKASTDDARKAIVADLSVARNMTGGLPDEPDVKKWIELNGVQSSELKTSGR